MDGIGSGRWRDSNAKDMTDDYCQLDIRRWQRGNLLIPGLAFISNWTRHGEPFASVKVIVEPDRIILNYCKSNGEAAWEHGRYPVDLTWTPCTYGGARAWFLCPGMNCGRRVAILYGGETFACRHCYKLAYTCQRELDYDQAIRRVDKIRDKLKWEPGFLNGGGWKPKGMHSHTFERLKAEHDALVKVAMAGIRLRFK